MEIVFAIFLRAALETYTAMAGDIPLAMAAAQAALQLWNQWVKQIKK